MVGYLSIWLYKVRVAISNMAQNRLILKIDP